MEQNEGWISLHRKLLDDPIMLKPNYLAVWVYILLKANYKDKSIIWNGRKVIINRGSYVGSISKISKELKISIGTVSNVLKYLISEKQVEKRSNKKFTLFKVINYDSYQVVEKRVENKLKTRCKQVETTNKDNNNNNNNNNIKSKDFEIPIIKNKENQILDIFYQESKDSNLFSNNTQRKAVIEMIKVFDFDELLKYCKFAINCLGKDFLPQAPTPLLLQKKMALIKAHCNKTEGNNQWRCKYGVLHDKGQVCECGRSSETMKMPIIKNTKSHSENMRILRESISGNKVIKNL